MTDGNEDDETQAQEARAEREGVKLKKKSAWKFVNDRERKNLCATGTIYNGVELFCTKRLNHRGKHENPAWSLTRNPKVTTAELIAASKREGKV